MILNFNFELSEEVKKINNKTLSWFQTMVLNSNLAGSNCTTGQKRETIKKLCTLIKKGTPPKSRHSSLESPNWLLGQKNLPF